MHSIWGTGPWAQMRKHESLSSFTSHGNLESASAGIVGDKPQQDLQVSLSGHLRNLGSVHDKVAADTHASHGFCTYLKYAEKESKGFMLPKESAQKGENYSRDKKTRPQLDDASEALMPLETQEHTTYGGTHRAQGAKGKRGRFCHHESPPDTQQPGDTHSHTLVSSTVNLVLFCPHLLTRHSAPYRWRRGAGGPSVSACCLTSPRNLTHSEPRTGGPITHAVLPAAPRSVRPAPFWENAASPGRTSAAHFTDTAAERAQLEPQCASERLPKGRRHQPLT